MQEVASEVFAYINMLAAPGGVSEKRFEENKALAELRFRFADKSTPYTYAERLSSAMQLYEDRSAQTCHMSTRYKRFICQIFYLTKFLVMMGSFQFHLNVVQKQQ